MGIAGTRDDGCQPARLALQADSPWQDRIDTLSPFELTPVTQRHPCAK